MLAQGEDIIPLIGARRRDLLAPQDLEAIEKAVPKGAAAGARYAEEQMANLDSERG